MEYTEYDYLSKDLGEIPVTHVRTEAGQIRLLNQKGISQQENDMLYERALDEVKSGRTSLQIRIDIDDALYIFLGKLRELRDECIAEKITKDAALKLRNQIVIDLKTDCLLKVPAVPAFLRAAYKPVLDELTDKALAASDFVEIDKQIEAMPDAQEKPVKPPLKGIDNLISEGWLANDGYRVIGDLNNVAMYLADREKVKITRSLIKLYFRKFDGTEYSDSAIIQAVNRANAS